MFGPNSRALFGVGPEFGFHHREPSYRRLLQQTTDLFRRKFNLAEDTIVFFITGSGTLANEIVISSLHRAGAWRVRPGAGRGEFGQRLWRMAHGHGRLLVDESQTYLQSPPGFDHYAMAAYETGESRVVNPEWPVGGAGLRFADCVSSFPYYPLPEGTNVWTTVSSKQLGALPVLGIIVVEQAAWKWLTDDRDCYSYLSLRRWRERLEMDGESPHTPAIPLLYDLNEQLLRLDLAKLRSMVERRRKWIERVVPKQGLLGEGPVCTIKSGWLGLKLIKKWGLYRSTHGSQLFLWSGTDEQYQEFLWDYEQEMNE